LPSFEAFRDDREVVEAAIESDGLELQYASLRLQGAAATATRRRAGGDIDGISASSASNKVSRNLITKGGRSGSA